VTVIIVNFNGGEYLLQCLSCLAEQDTPPEQIVLINNCSTDGSAAAARASNVINAAPNLVPAELLAIQGR
jgi:GT2 family glycosyltransferase